MTDTEIITQINFMFQQANLKTRVVGKNKEGGLYIKVDEQDKDLPKVFKIIVETEELHQNNLIYKRD